MSGFSAEWLALREPADHRARDPGLLARLRAHFAGRNAIRIVDLGCGTGSNLRALAPHLPQRQSWTLVDHDPALLDAARERLSAWAERAGAGPQGLRLEPGGRTLEICFLQADLAAGPESAFEGAPDLVTAAALFDLVSPAWIARFAAAAAERGAAFYTALSYDGVEHWNPPHPADAAMLAAFTAHQRRDKGFGPAAGPRATALLEALFRGKGYEVHTAESPWRLGCEDAALVRALAEGAAAAVRETGQVSEAAITAWLAARRFGASCEIGHRDLLALPPR